MLRPPEPGEASFFYRDPHFKINAVKVLPGEHYVTQENLMISTVLGSCVAACLWDPTAKIGGMNHFMMPDGHGETSGRYGAFAMESLLKHMMELGARRESMQAKVFGGGQVLHGLTRLSVGERNTDFVDRYLAAERIAVVSRDVLDIYPRRLCFFPTTGQAMVKRLSHAHPDRQPSRAGEVSVGMVAATKPGDKGGT